MSDRKIAVITGGSKGLGLAMAKFLSTKEGYFVLLIARSKSELNKAVIEINKIKGEAAAYEADVSDAASVRNIVREIREKYGGIDFLINNACLVHVGELVDLQHEEIKKDIEIGLFGSILCTKLFLPIMNNRGKILFISSGFGLIGPAGYSVYAAIKAGIINFAESIKREARKMSVNVYVAVPSDIDTPGYRDEIESMPKWMSLAQARGRVMSSDVAAAKILSKCRGVNTLIFINFNISALYLMIRILPRNILDFILDQIFPAPR